MAGGSSTPLLGNSGPSGGYALRRAFAAIAGVTLLILVVLFFAFVRYDGAHNAGDYFWYVHVGIIVWVGFGFLPTFLNHYSFGAVALSFFGSCAVTLEALFIIGAFIYSQERHSDDSTLVVNLNISLLIQGLFAAAAAMVTFGAVLGRASPSQLLLLMILEVPFYAVNSYFLVHLQFEASDVGGSIAVHTFGAYFGLAASLFISKRGGGSAQGQHAGGYNYFVISMIGTIFLWVFLPSFNAAMASGGLRFLAVVNTIMSLLGACFATFVMSALLEGKFNMVYIQNATLAGGVAIGSSADLVSTNPGGALLIGICGAILSVTGFKYIGPSLEKGIKLKDTRGVHNLHGLPGILGGVAAALILLSKDCGKDNCGSQAFGQELLALVVTLGISILGGIVSGGLVSLMGGIDGRNDAFDDNAAFGV